MIKVKGLCKSFNDVEVLKDIDINFEKGKINLIIGQSGSGKSVLTKCMVGLMQPSAGIVRYDGVDFHSLNFNDKKEIRKKMGMLFQASALFDSKTVLENVMFPLSMFTDMSKEEQRERAIFCLQRVNIIDKEELFPAEISGGMQKRVAIARAIAMKPDYLFCDEPNSGLDPQTSILIDNLIKDLTTEYDMTTIVITHDMNSVIEIGDNITFIHEGTVTWQGNKKEIFTSQNAILDEFVFASEFMQEIKENLKNSR